jgi:biopolymer transport protein ExbD
VYYRDQQIDTKDLAHRLDEDRRTDRSIIIQADRSAPHGTVVEVTNLCLERGYSVMLATSPRSQ